MIRIPPTGQARGFPAHDNEDVFLLLGINVQDRNVEYFKLEALFSTGERGEISLFKEYNLKLIQ